MNPATSTFPATPTSSLPPSTNENPIKKPAVQSAASVLALPVLPLQQHGGGTVLLLKKAAGNPTTTHHATAPSSSVSTSKKPRVFKDKDIMMVSAMGVIRRKSPAKITTAAVATPPITLPGQRLLLPAPQTSRALAATMAAAAGVPPSSAVAAAATLRRPMLLPAQSRNPNSPSAVAVNLAMSPNMTLPSARRVALVSASLYPGPPAAAISRTGAAASPGTPPRVLGNLALRQKDLVFVQQTPLSSSSSPSSSRSSNRGPSTPDHRGSSHTSVSHISEAEAVSSLVRLSGSPMAQQPRRSFAEDPQNTILSRRVRLSTERTKLTKRLKGKPLLVYHF